MLTQLQPDVFCAGFSSVGKLRLYQMPFGAEENIDQQFFAEKTLRQASGGYPVGLKTLECLARVQIGGLSYPWKSNDSVLTG